MRYFVFIVTLLIVRGSFAATQTVVCTGTGESGNSYRFTMELNDAQAVAIRSPRSRTFEQQYIILEEFDANGTRLFHHREALEGLLVDPPEANQDRDEFTYFATGANSIYFRGFGADSRENDEYRHLVRVDAGRFRGIAFDHGNCSISGVFPERETIIDEANARIRRVEEGLRAQAIHNVEMERFLRALRNSRYNNQLNQEAATGQ